MLGRSVYTVNYFVSGNSNVWLSGIKTIKEAETVASKLRKKCPKFDVFISYGVDPRIGY